VVDCTPALPLRQPPDDAETLRFAQGDDPAEEGFFVRGKKGPLQEGELARAAEWARGLAET
jgi:hypothetical protein